MSNEEEKARIRQYTSEAVALAVQGQWEKAIAVNKAILELSPTDVEAYNRLGRALMELGRYAEARGAYSQGLKLDPYNRIAKKNLSRLSRLEGLSLSPKEDHHKIPVELFVEEGGKAGVVKLIHLAPWEVIARMAPGNEVHLEVRGQRLLVRDGWGEYLGEVEPRHGLRLAQLIKGGNEYVGAIASLEENEVKVLIREIYQHPSQGGRPSFLPKTREDFRPYTKEGLLKYEPEAEEELGEEEALEGFTLETYNDPEAEEE